MHFALNCRFSDAPWTQQQVKHTHADGRRLKTQVIEAINELIDELDGIRSQIAEQVGGARMRRMALSAQRSGGDS
jgi:hypothetical protein